MPSPRVPSSQRAPVRPSAAVAVVAGAGVAGLAAVGRAVWLAGHARRFAAVRGPRFERGTTTAALPPEASA